MTAITEPGVYDLPADIYHADPVPGGSLSQSGAKLLLPPDCPARFRYVADNPEVHKRTYDFGHAAHKLILGAGAELAVIDADNYKTKAAQQAKADAYAADMVPLLPVEHETVLAMAAALRAHPIAGRLFAPGTGEPEKALFWRDGTVMRRALLDWLPNGQPDRRLIVPDYKTTQSADPEKLQRTIETFGYHRQAAWYLDGIRALGLNATPVFLLVFQEKTPPYLVTVAEPDVVALRVGHYLNRQAIDLYADCVAAGQWPGYSDGIELIPLPPYIENKFLEEMQP